MTPPTSVETRPPVGMRIGLRSASLITSIAAIALAGLVLTVAPGGASAGRASTHLVTIARYRAGAATRDNLGRAWLSDARLSPGGHLVRNDSKQFARHSALYRVARVDAQHYSVALPNAGKFRVVMRSLRCVKSGCSVVKARTTVSVGGGGPTFVQAPRMARSIGVSTVVVRRFVTAAGQRHRPKQVVPTTGQPSPPAPPLTTSPSGSSGGVASTPQSILQPRNVVNASSVWRQNITSAPTASNSSAEVADLVEQVNEYYGGNAAFNVTEYNPTWYTVDADQATTTVGFTNCQNKSSTPSGLYGRGGQFVDVPIPDDAVPSAGTDANLTIYRPSTDQLWDFWEMSHSSAGWSACWGGRIDHVSSSNGQFPENFGASASGLASEFGDISITDAKSGRIDHAITLTIPNAANWDDYSWPAQRGDGSTSDPDAIPEGTRLRLDPHLDVDSLHLSPLASMIAKAAQKYGFIVTDRSGCVAVDAESGAPTQQLTGTNPWAAILNGVQPYAVMANFPWNRLSALPKNYGNRIRDTCGVCSPDGGPSI